MNVSDTRATSALLYLDGVHVSFDGFHAINNLSLTLAPGEMRAVIGPNGAGKTTMMDIITGKTKPDEGEVLFDGVTDLTRLDETRIAELGIGRKFQKPTVFESQTIEDNLLLALNVDHRVRGTLFWRESKAESERIEKVLETIRLTHDLRPPTRRQGDLPARRLGAGGGNHRSGFVERAGDRSVSGKVIVFGKSHSGAPRSGEPGISTTRSRSSAIARFRMQAQGACSGMTKGFWSC